MTSRPRVLWLCRHMPLPPDAGDKIYTHLLVCGLAEAGASVTFMAMVDEQYRGGRSTETGIRWVPITAAPRHALRSAFSLMPQVTARHATAAYAKALQTELGRSRYDCFVLDYYALGWALDAVPIGPCLVYVSHNYETGVMAAIARGYRGNWLKKALLYVNALKSARLERQLVRSADVLTVISNEDAVQYQKLAPKRPPLILRPGYSGYRSGERQITASVPRRVLILGSFRWIAKQISLDRFLEAADGPCTQAGIEIEIIGTIGEELRARWETRLHATRFRGFVTNLERHFAQARMGLVIEGTGGGFKLKTLDYVFGRLPIASLGSALDGIDDDLKAYFIIEQQLDRLVSTICGTIDDLDRLNAMQQGAFDTAQGRFDWKSNGVAMLKVIEDSIKHPIRAV
jgi:glycosyl transferase family 4